MESVKYFYEVNDNRNLPEEKQGYAYITLVSASTKSLLTNHLVGESIKAGKKEIKIDFAQKSLEMNMKHCPKVYNVTCPLTGEIYHELTIQQIYEMGQFSDLYEELSNAVGDVSTLKEGIKKK